MLGIVILFSPISANSLPLLLKTPNQGARQEKKEANNLLADLL